MRFEWDTDKAARNVAKHGISFEEAATVDTIRIINARPATSGERQIDEEG